MKLSVDELLKAVGCDKIPERWEKIYDDAMAEFYQCGCEVLRPEYYDELADKYNAVVKYRDIYKHCTEKISESEAMSAFLHLICYALRDRSNAMDEAYELELLKHHDDEHNIAYNMITGIANCSLVPYCYENLKAKGIPDDVIASSLKFPDKGIDEYKDLHNGEYGYENFAWYQLTVDGKLFRLGRLEIEPYAIFPDKAFVFVNKAGDYVALANNLALHRDGFPLGSRGYEDETGSFTATISETDTHWLGYPFLESGYVDKQCVSLPKSEWKVKLSPNDKVINLHIPSGESFTPEIIDDTINNIKNFMKVYFPEVEYKAFVCHSWIIDSQLEELLGQDSNIVKFGKRFNRFAVKSDGIGVFRFVFNYPLSGNEPDIQKLNENTRLEKAIKKHYLQGNAIYEMYGYFF